MLREVRKLQHTKTKFAKTMDRRPTSAEGTDGEVRIVRESSGVNFYVKYKGIWYSFVSSAAYNAAISDSLTAETIITDKVSAIDGDGLLLQDDDGNGIFIKDGGNVGIGTTDSNNLIQVADLISFTNADWRTQIGYQAGKYDLGQYNTWIGYQAGSANNATDKTNAADFNTGAGYQADRKSVV